ncbi:MAG: DNA polymerase IV [Thermoanaerobaculia bacterium]
MPAMPGPGPFGRIRRILHCDMDCFYAAVHARDDPSLRERPLIVGGSPEGRGVVAAASYEARRFGVHSAMPAARAARLCPGAVFLPADFPRYRRESEEIFRIYREYTPLVQAVSIDEAYLDVTEHLGELGSATAVAREIRRRVRSERGLTVSVGVGPSKLVAKIASDADKPDGLTVVRPAEVEGFLGPLPVRRLHGVGPATERALETLGVRTVAELRGLDRELLAGRFGRHGEVLWRFARGIDDREVTTRRERKSLGKETTFRRDLADPGEMASAIDELARSVGQGLERRGLTGCTVTLKVRYGDFTTVTRSATRPVPTRCPEEISAAARELLGRTEAGHRPVRLLGVTVSKLVESEAGQMSLFS